MADPRPGWTDEHVELLVGRLLQAGVLLAALVVLFGALVYLIRHGQEPVAYGAFHGEPPALRELKGIETEVLDFHGRGIIQLGLILLIATPVARVGLLTIAFLRQKDVIYVLVTLFVLGILLYSLFQG